MDYGRTVLLERLLQCSFNQAAFFVDSGKPRWKQATATEATYRGIEREDRLEFLPSWDSMDQDLLSLYGLIILRCPFRYYIKRESNEPESLIFDHPVPKL